MQQRARGLALSNDSSRIVDNDLPAVNPYGHCGRWSINQGRSSGPKQGFVYV